MKRKNKIKNIFIIFLVIIGLSISFINTNFLYPSYEPNISKIDSYFFEEKSLCNPIGSLYIEDCNPNFLIPTYLNDYTIETDIIEGLQDTLDNYLGSSIIDINNDQTQYQRWDYENSISEISLEFEFVGNSAGNQNVFGYYFDNNPDSFIGVFEIPDINGNDHSGYNLPIASPGDSFIITDIPRSLLGHLGFAIDSELSNGDTYKLFSENNLNPDNLDRALVFTLCDEIYDMIYVVCFEDLPDDTHKDFNDAIAIIRVLEGTYCLEAHDDSYSVDEGDILNVAAPGVLENDDYQCGNTLIADLLTNPSHALSFNLYPDGSFTYVHDGSETISDSFTYNSTDMYGAYDHATVTLSINPQNDPPTLNPIGPQTIEEENKLSFTATATDPDYPPQILTFSLDNEPIGATITTNGKFTWTPTESQGPNTYTLDVIVSDGQEIDSETITITVLEDNQPPTLNPIGPQTIEEENLLTFTATATDPDIPAQTLTFSLDNEPSGASIHPITGIFTWTPNENQGPNTYILDVIVSDGQEIDSETITITVTQGNEPPELDPIEPQTIQEEKQLTFTATATDPDQPPQKLTFNLINPPGGAYINPITGIFTWTPNENQGPKTYKFDITVTDEVGAYDKESITITVLEDNQPPTLNPIGPQTIEEENLLTFTATATDPDIPAQTLNFSLNGEPTGAIITTDGLFTWTPNENQGPNTYTFDIIVTDELLENDTETITVTVTQGNSPPNKPINPYPNDGNNNVGINAILRVYVTDPNMDVLNISFYDASDDSLIGNATDILSGGFASVVWSGLSYLTSYSWYAIANDSEFDTKSDTWKFRTMGEPMPPIENKKPVADISAGEPYLGLVGEDITFDGSLSYDPDPGGYIVSWHWDFDDGTDEEGEIVTHNFSSERTYEVTLTVTDDQGATDEETFDVVISILNNPPEGLIVSGPIIGKQYKDYEYIATATDIDDNDMLRYIFEWGDGTTTTSDVVESGLPAAVTHSWSSYGVYNVKVTAEDNYSAQISTEVTVLIDVIIIDDEIKGLIIDEDGNDPFDIFNNSETESETIVAYDNGSYLIDSDGDNRWEYAYDSENGLITYYEFVYNKFFKIYETKKAAPGFEFISLLAVITLLSIILRRKRKNN